VVRCVVHDDVGVVEVLHDAVEGDNARVSGCDLMQTVKGKNPQILVKRKSGGLYIR
jgi:hypothetical protein